MFLCTQLVNCGLSDVTIKALEARGITALFPIQKHVYEPAAAGEPHFLLPLLNRSDICSRPVAKGSLVACQSLEPFELSGTGPAAVTVDIGLAPKQNKLGQKMLLCPGHLAALQTQVGGTSKAAFVWSLAGLFTDSILLTDYSTCDSLTVAHAAVLSRLWGCLVVCQETSNRTFCRMLVGT